MDAKTCSFFSVSSRKELLRILAILGRTRSIEHILPYILVKS